MIGCPRRQSNSHEQLTYISFAEDVTSFAEGNWASLAHAIHRLFQLRRLWAALGRHLQRYSSLRDSHGQGQVHAGHQSDAQSAH